MHQVKKEDAIREYGVRYVPALESLDIDLQPESPGNPLEALARKLESLSKSAFDGTIYLLQELGAPTQSFHYKDLQDVHHRYEIAQRAHYQKTLETLTDLIISNADMLEQDGSQMPEQQRLKAAFEKASEKIGMIDAFLNSRLSFKVGTHWLDDALTLPDTIAKTGDAVFVVKDDGKAMPVLVEATVGQRDFSGSLFRKSSIDVSYEINTGDASPVRDENKFFSLDASKTKVPSGVFAKGRNQLAFNSKAAAVEYLGEVLDARENLLKAEMKQIRATRRELGKISL